MDLGLNRKDKIINFWFAILKIILNLDIKSLSPVF